MNPRSCYTTKHILTCTYEQLKSYYDPCYQALWVTFDPFPTLTLTDQLLNNIRNLQDKIATAYFNKPQCAPKYIIWQSSNRDVFNLGLDLNHIIQLLHAHDEEGLNNYLQLFIDVFFINQRKLDIEKMITISLIRGKAYGAGFEAALASDLIFAEDDSKCCFSEIQSRLLPSLGTIWRHAKNLDLTILKKSILEEPYFAVNELCQKGIVHKTSAAYHGEEFVKEYMQKHYRNYNLLCSLMQKKSEKYLLSLSKLEEIKSFWLTSLRNLTKIEISILERIAAIQTQPSNPEKEVFYPKERLVMASK